MALVVKIGNGFAEVGAGLWLMGRSQPAAFFGKAVRHRRKGWCVRDRASLELVETTAVAKCADSSRPFLTHIPCAAPVFAVSGKVLVAPASSRKDAHLVKVIPMSAKQSLCVTEFLQPDEEPETRDGQPSDRQAVRPSNDSAWVVMATSGRTARIQLVEGDTFSARPEAVVAWTGKRPTGFCPRLSIWDILLPRGSRDLLLTFYGPSIVWLEGSCASKLSVGNSRLSPFRRGYGV